ncbi:hypothetical protein BJY01DRAFT_69744 [Aspergillus pseudoustus]|uniref:Amine oxidase domain-containing protein n=1 Tax=Aspergillus pseudoustus TaxID=1810923 RepID=A0ABR4L0M2_9EURO
MALSEPRKVAIIGGGLTGVASFWALQSSRHDVYLFEASPALGGHMKSFLFESRGNQVQVDLEPPTFNPEACPNLVSLLYYLKIPTTSVPFTFGALDESSVTKWHISILRSIFLCPQILCKLETYRLLLDVLSLRYLGADALVSPASEFVGAEYLADNYLAEKGYSNNFRDRYLTPLLSMLWRTNAGRYLPHIPIKALARSLRDHQLLSTCELIPRWRRIDPGVRHLIEAMVRHLPHDKVYLQTKVHKVTQHSTSQYDLLTSGDKQSHVKDFDHVIFTVDGPEILQLLGPTIDAEEKDILRSLSVTRNIAILHSENSPMGENAVPGHNYIMASRNRQKPDFVPPMTCLTYDVNALQDISTSRFGDVLITLNPLSPPHPSLVQGVWEFTEPEPTAGSLEAQSRLPLIQNKRGLSYGFCWTGRGVLEDAITSGLRMAVEDLGATIPFNVVSHSEPLGTTDCSKRRPGIRIHLIKTALQALRVLVVALEIILLLLGRVHTPGSKARARLSLSRILRPS